MDPDEYNHALSMIRVKLRAGVIEHPDWPPPPDMSIERQLLHLDRLAEKILRERMRSVYK